MTASVSTASAAPGGGGVAPPGVTGAEVGDSSLSVAHAASSEDAAATPRPMSPSLRNASRRDSSPSAWSIAISSAI
ncbi:hypothetical protein Rwratislav_35044 [Rhodococcus wratislaviensis IFP 2016]|nr:hypothetical protein Rwratislav_35044 [Rhodococcus wratislaviensis IFP 2016]